MSDLEAENAQLRATVAELQKDAARWRWFRENGDSWESPSRPAWCYFEIGVDPEKLDAAIDRAIEMGAEAGNG